MEVDWDGSSEGAIRVMREVALGRAHRLLRSEPIDFRYACSFRSFGDFQQALTVFSCPCLFSLQLRVKRLCLLFSNKLYP